ncbi:hypothetical protein HWV62_41613 [Athelia sp. TMB]|nr:hypothetical protein HWV62_41613 [Athelia sp. TMB]
MSRTPSPSSSPVPYEQPATPPPPGARTRTVAIIKNHALDRRFDIEPRILQADFEIVKERQMEFDTETDPETLYELFGDDAACLAEGPVWVYVLERRRAVEVWNTLMGDADPAVARAAAPTSLRALYGLSARQNGVMGAPDTPTAEIQIASLFASSPVYPTSPLPDEPNSPAPSNLTAQIMETLQRATPRGTGPGYPASSVTSPSVSSPGTQRSRVDSSGKPAFRARPVPPTNIAPDIAPRTTKAAALRAGLDISPSARGPRVAPTREQQTQAFMDVPGHKRSSTITVASTAAPAIAPRMTKAAALRLGLPPPEPVRPRTMSAASGAGAGTFDGVPGHKRRESIAVASTRAPAVGPRLNRSAALRAEKDKAPPTSFQFRPPVKSTPSQAGSRPPSRPSSAQSVRAPSAPLMRRAPSLPAPGSAPAVAPPLKRRLSSLAAPAIAPRPNRSAQLRAAQMEAASAKPAAPRALRA